MTFHKNRTFHIRQRIEYIIIHDKRGFGHFLSKGWMLIFQSNDQGSIITTLTLTLTTVAKYLSDIMLCCVRSYKEVKYRRSGAHDLDKLGAIGGER